MGRVGSPFLSKEELKSCGINRFLLGFEFFLNPQVQGEVLGMSGKVQELQINRFHRFVFNLKARFE